MKLEDKILDRVDILAEKTNNISSKAWSSLVSYEQLSGLIDVITGIIFIIITSFLVVYCLKQRKLIDEDNENNFKIKEKQTTDLFGHPVVIEEKVPIKKSLMYVNKGDNRSYYDVGDLTTFGWIMIVLVLVFTILSFASVLYAIPVGISKMVNPEIFAIKELVEQIKGK